MTFYPCVFVYLAGQLPAEWCKMRRLASMDLSHNKLDGALPPKWGQLTELTKLRLSRNSKLAHDVPEQWAELRVKAQLDIGDQKLVLEKANAAGLVAKPAEEAL